MNRDKKIRFWDGSQWSYFVIGQIWSDWMLSVYNDHVLNGREPFEYIELKDRNGKEIWEGDFVKVLRGSPEALANIYQIKYTNAAFQMWGKGNATPTAFVTYAKQCIDHGVEFEEIGDLIEVIGNIHENPELL